MTESNGPLADREALWEIWDVLQMWRDDDHQWSSDEIELVAQTMLAWTGDRHALPPQEFRRQDPENYEQTIDGHQNEPDVDDGFPMYLEYSDEPGLNAQPAMNPDPHDW